MAATVFVIFADWDQAHRAIDRLHDAGFDAQETNVMGPHGLTDAATDTDSTRYFSGTSHSSEEDGATVGAVAGAAFGGAAGWALGLTLLAIPGVGPIMVAGPMLAGLAGFLAGGATGGFIGGMTGMGVPESQANLYHEHVSQGRIVISVPHTDRAAEVRTLMESAGALETHQHTVNEAPYQDTVTVGMARSDRSPGVQPGIAGSSAMTSTSVSGTQVPHQDLHLDDEDERTAAAAGAPINADSGI